MKVARLHLGDRVRVNAGDDKGAIGKILGVIRKKEMVSSQTSATSTWLLADVCPVPQVVVEGVNINTKHVKPTKGGEPGRVDKKEFPIHMSNVAFISSSE